MLGKILGFQHFDYKEEAIFIDLSWVVFLPAGRGVWKMKTNQNLEEDPNGNAEKERVIRHGYFKRAVFDWTPMFYHHSCT